MRYHDNDAPGFPFSLVALALAIVLTIVVLAVWPHGWDERDAPPERDVRDAERR
jgi:hypothetical protein